MDEQGWPTDWSRATLPLVLLGIAVRGEARSYAILQTLTEVGLGSVKGGTLYPLLSRQQDLGRIDIDHRWKTGSPGPARKVFHLTHLTHLTHQGRQDSTGWPMSGATSTRL